MSDFLGDYLQTIGRVPLLSANEEITLGHRVQAMLQVRQERPEQDWTALERRTVRSGERAKRKMVESNLRLVVSCAKKYIDLAKQLELGDLISEGNIGLVRAVEKYDPTRGYKFSTYAYWWIRQGVTRAMTQQDRSIRLPCNAVTALGNARKFMMEYRIEHGQLPNVQKIAEHCNVPEPTMKAYLRHINDCGSLNAKTALSKDDSSTIMDFIADPSSLEEHEFKMDDDDINQLFQHIDSLDERTAQVLKMRYGIDGYHEHTLLEAGSSLEVSRERARQIELRGIRKLRLKLMQTTCLGKICA